MLIFILGIIVTALLVVLCLLLFLLGKEKNRLAACMGSSTIIVVGVLFSLILGLISPISGYEKMKFEERIPLVALNNSTEVTSDAGVVYVSLSSDNVYTYSYEVDPEITISDSKNCIIDTISENVIVLEEPECEVPELLVYKQKAKLSIWTFGLYWKTTNIFHIPPDTIDKTGTVIEDTN